MRFFKSWVLSVLVCGLAAGAWGNPYDRSGVGNWIWDETVPDRQECRFVREFEIPDGAVTLDWEPVTGASAYRVKRSTAEAEPYTVVADALADTTCTDAAVTNGTTYYHAVSALVSGVETPDSGARAARPAGAPQTVSWNFDRFGTVGGALVAGVVPAANWTNSWPNDPRTDLVDSQGAPTTLDIAYASYGTWSIQGASPALDADGTGNKRILNGYLNSGRAAWGPPITSSTVTLSEIPHGYYDLIVYFSSDVAGREGEVSDGRTTYYFKSAGPAGLSGANAVFTATTQKTPDLYPTANYAVFSGLAGTSRTVNVQMRDSDEWGGIAAVQVVPRVDVLSTTAVHVALAPAGDAIWLSWPQGLGEVVLEESEDLVSWMPTDPQPLLNEASVTLRGPRQFYRLRRPSGS